MRVGIGARGKVQQVGSRRVSLGAEIEDVAYKRRVVTKIKVRVGVASVIELDWCIVASLRDAHRMHHDRWRRHVVSRGIAELKLDGIRAAALLRHAGIVERADL